MITFSPEIQLLFCCTRYTSTQDNDKKIRSLTAQELDWERVLTLAKQHALIPLLRTHLSSIPDIEIPPEINEQLIQQTRHLNALHLFQLAKMLQLQEELCELGIDALYYKGAILDQMLYDGKCLRLSSDLDFLIDQEDAPAIRDLLFEKGYRPKRAETLQQEKLLFRRYKDYGFVHPKTKHVIEVHWSVVEKQFSSRFDRQFFFNTQEQFIVNALPFSVMTKEDMLILLCLHGAIHEWDRLKWLGDIHELISSSPDLNWSRISEKARLWELSNVLYLGLWFANEWLGTETPAFILDSAKAHPVVRQLYMHVVRNFYRQYDCPDDAIMASLNRVTYHSSLPETWSSRIFYLWLVVVNANMNDAHSIALPWWLSPAYVILRPIRLAHKWGVGYLAAVLLRMAKSTVEPKNQ